MNLTFRAILALACMTPLTVNAEAPPISLEGYWSAAYETVVDWDLPVVGKTQQKVSVLSVWSIAQDGFQFRAKESVCRIEMDSGNQWVQLSMNAPSPKGLSGTEYTGKWIVGTRGWSIKTFPLRRFHGLKKPWPKDLPETIAETQVVDVDGDGKPGLTLFLRGMVVSNLEAIQRDDIVFEGALQGDGSILGTVDWKWERKLLQSSNSHVTEMPRETWNPKLALRTFKLTQQEIEGCLPPSKGP